MPIEWESKFQSVGLGEKDCPGLLHEIERTDDTGKLLSLLYMYGYSCRPSLKLISICDNYIKNPVPGLTAVCLRVLADYWSMWQNYSAEIESYLDRDKFDDWYDEVIFAVGFVTDNSDYSFPNDWVAKAQAIKNDTQLSRKGLI